MRNSEVIHCFVNGYSAQSSTGNLRCESGRLYSYDLKIAEFVGGALTIFNYTASGEYVSQTTSCHVGMVIRGAKDFTLVPP